MGCRALPRTAQAALVALVAALSAAPSRAAPPWAAGASRGEDLVVSLVTFGPGDEVVTWFGHTALAVEDTRLGFRRLYNYGNFSFDRTTLPRFALGRLRFWADDTPVNPVLEAYAADNRDVRVRELRLAPAQRLALAQALAENTLPQNRYYLYHHFADNCATRPRDVIDRALGGRLRQATSGPARMTLRRHTRRHTAINPPMSVVIDFLMNDEVDQPVARRDEAFLPAELERQVGELKAEDGTSLAGPAVVYFEAGRAPVPESPPDFLPWLLAAGVAWGAIGFELSRRAGRHRVGRILAGAYQTGTGVLLGGPGLVLALMWGFTEHTVTYRNENILLANPLHLALVPLGVALALGSSRAAPSLRRLWTVLAALGLAALALKPLPWFDQDNAGLVALVLPVALGNALGLRAGARAARRSVQVS